MSKDVKINMKYGRFSITHFGMNTQVKIIIEGQRQYGCNSPMYTITVPLYPYDINEIAQGLAKVHSDNIEEVKRLADEFKEAVKVKE